MGTQKYHVVSTKEKSADLELVDDSLDTKAGALLNVS